MGIAKRMWEEEQERGYSANEGITVCTNCFEEYGLRRFIEDNQTGSSCSYCEVQGEDVAACELDLLIEHIVSSILLEWGHPANEGLPYETREGGWQVAPVYDTWDLLDEIGLGNLHGDTYNDICTSIHNQEWCEKNPYSLSIDRTLFFGWQKFSDFVKNKARYLFLRTKNPDYDEHQHDEMDPIRILDALGEIVMSIGLIKPISVDEEIRRVRITDPEKILNSAKDLGSPPIGFATMANRMSPAGIPMFYGAFDIETTILETYTPCKSDKKANCGIFKPTRDLLVIDLSATPYVPSLFDEYERNKRDYMKFLFDFIDDFTKPIERSDRVHIDYVPTQIVTEYFRYVFESEDNTPIDGVIYPSSKNEGKQAIVLFAASEQCAEAEDSRTENKLLRLVDIESRDLKGV